MTRPNVTRRRVLLGAGAVGVASLGSTTISAQEDADQSTAIRAVHMSPDAPDVDIRLESTDGGTADGANETTNGNQTDSGQAEDGTATIQGLGFGDVSDYNEVPPGTYQIAVVSAGGGPIGDFVEDLFGEEDGEEDGDGGGDEETVLLQGEIDAEEGMAYTVVAFGEAARGASSAGGVEMGDGTAGNETDGIGDDETDGITDDGTDGVGNETEGIGDDDTDDLGTEGEQLVSELSFGESETVDLDAGDYTLSFQQADAEMDDAAGDGLTDGETDDVGDGDGETGGIGNETDVGGLDGNETDGVGGDGGGIGSNETDGVGNDTDEAGNETDDIGADAIGEGTTAQGTGTQRGLQAAVLEDDVSDPGDESARLRIFHAVPDVDSMSVSRMDARTGTGTSDEVGTTPTEADGDTATAEADGGTGMQEDGGIVDNKTDGGVGGDGADEAEDAGSAEQPMGDVRQADFSADSNTAYSGFAAGYFQPPAGGEPAPEGGDDNTTDGSGIEQNQTDAQDDEATPEDDADEGFRFLTVEDAQNGERANGGTGGILDLVLPAQ